jgi:uncharacterized protein with PIN domain
VSLFVCDECNVIANTATDGYWEQMVDQQDVPRDKRIYHCSQCRKGRWHGLFPRMEFDGTQTVINRTADGEHTDR